MQLTGLPPSQGGLTDDEIRAMVKAGWELDTQGISHADLVELSGSELHRPGRGRAPHDPAAASRAGQLVLLPVGPVRRHRDRRGQGGRLQGLDDRRPRVGEPNLRIPTAPAAEDRSAAPRPRRCSARSPRHRARRRPRARTRRARRESGESERRPPMLPDTRPRPGRSGSAPPSSTVAIATVAGLRAQAGRTGRLAQRRLPPRGAARLHLLGPVTRSADRARLAPPRSTSSTCRRPAASRSPTAATGSRWRRSSWSR